MDLTDNEITILLQGIIYTLQLEEASIESETGKPQQPRAPRLEAVKEAIEFIKSRVGELDTPSFEELDILFTKIVEKAKQEKVRSDNGKIPIQPNCPYLH